MVRGSLGSTQFGLSTTTSKYGFWAIPVPAFLELDGWQPHQNLRAAGKLREISDEDDVEVMFISHQWTAFNHPDPGGEQLQSLQRLIRTLMEGKTEVSSNFMLNAMYNSKMGMTGKEWKARLPAMYLWIDYISIPQPGALIAAEAPPLESTELKLELGDDDGRTTAPIDEQDHRKMRTTDEKMAELIEQLKGAVESIPSYIERSSQMWILVPPVKHADLENAVCDFNSWRRRGWCRMEFAAAKLAVGEDMPLMVIKSTVDMTQAGVQYFNPCDTFKLCASKGDFSVESDRACVNETLGKMVRAKAAYYEDLGEPTLARLVQCFAPVFVPREAIGEHGAPAGADPAMPDGADAPAGDTPLDRLKRSFNWRSEAEERAWAADTGLSLLTLACALDDADAVDELLRQPEAEVRAMLDSEGSKKLVVKPGSKATKTSTSARLRSEPFGQLVCAYAEGMTPLIAAMTFASASVVEKLINAGADIERDGLELLGMKPCKFRGAILAGKVDNVRLLLDRCPQLINKQNATSKSTPLHMACWIGKGQNQAAIIELLIERGAKDSLHTRNMFNETPIQLLAKIYDQDPEAIKLLLDAAGDEAAVLVTEPIAKLDAPLRYGVGPIMGVMARAGVPVGIGFKKLLKSYAKEVGSTAVHRAAERGDVQMLKLFKEAADVHAAHPHLTDARKQTPIDCAAQACQPTPHYQTVIRDVLGEIEAGQLAPLPQHKLAKDSRRK